MKRLGEDRCIRLQQEAMQFGHADRMTRYRKIMSVLGRATHPSAFLSKGQYFVIRARHDRSTFSHKQRYNQEALETYRLFQYDAFFAGTLAYQAQAERQQRENI